jgi:hypothetical protein
MTTNLETIKVYIPDEGKALKVMQNNKLVMYMLEPLYYLPNYTYDVIEVDKEEAIKWINRTKVFTQKLFKKK